MNRSNRRPRPLTHGPTSRRQLRHRRAGVSAVEFALIAPVLFLLFFGAIEFARLNQVSNATAFSAYEGCRRAIVPGATADNATAAAQAILDSNLVKFATITVNPNPILAATSTVTVTVSVPMDKNVWAAPIFTKGRTVSRTCTLTREQTN